jgi:hypothetical protein
MENIVIDSGMTFVQGLTLLINAGILIWIYRVMNWRYAKQQEVIKSQDGKIADQYDKIESLESKVDSLAQKYEKKSKDFNIIRGIILNHRQCSNKPEGTECNVYKEYLKATEEQGMI